MRGALCCAPAFVVMLVGSTSVGAMTAIGCLPVAMAGVPPVRRSRVRLVLVGAVFAGAYAIGAAIAGWPVVAITVAALYAAFTVFAAFRRPALKGVIGITVPALVLGMNMSPGTGAVLALVFLAGAAWSTAVALCWPVDAVPGGSPPSASAPTTAMRPPRPVVLYACSFAAAVAIGLTIGLSGDFDHVAWVAGAAVLIMRPEPELAWHRAVGRVVATYLGVAIAALLDARGIGEVAFAVVVVLAVATAVGTRTSRWYVTPGFTGLVVLLIAGVSGTDAFEVTFADRVLETTIGAALAIVFGTLVPRLAVRRAAA